MNIAGYYVYNPPEPSFDYADAIEAVKGYIDYFCYRCIKSDLSGDTANTSLYKRDTGNGAFEKVVEEMREDLKNRKS